MTVARPGFADLLAAPTVEARLAQLHSAGLDDESGLTRLLDRVEELVHDNPQAAEGLASLCEAAADPAGLRAVEARARYLRARVLTERGELDAALGLIDSARAGWWSAGQYLSALRTDLGRMHVLDDLGRHRAAVAVGEALLAELDRLPAGVVEPGPVSWLRAATLDNIGVACGLVGEHEQALEAFAHSESIYRAHGMTGEIARPMANRGLELLKLGRVREARTVLAATAEAFTLAGDRLWSAKCLGDLAQAHQQLGELVAALRVLESARVTMDELGATAEAARLQLATAGAYLDLGLPAEARAEAIAAAARTEAAGMLHDTGSARFTIALAHLATRRFAEASTELTAAATLFERVDARGELARVRLAEAEIALAGGHRDEAARLAATAATAAEAGGWLIPLAVARMQQADLAVDDATTAAHLDDADLILDRIRSPHLRYRHRLLLARLRGRQGRAGEAEALLRLAIEDVEQRGGSIPGHALRTAYRADTLGAHDALVELLVGRGGPRDVVEAHQVSERAKAQTLVDLMSGTVGGGYAHDGSGGPLERCRADLNAVYSTMLAAADPSSRALLGRRADELEGQLSAMLVRSDIAGPGPVPVWTDRTEPPVSGAPASVATLAYHILGDDVVAFVVRDGRVSARVLDTVMPSIDVELDRLAAQWSRFTVGASFVRRHEAALLATAQDILGALHRLIVAPVAPLLDGLAGEELVIVPHRRLHQIPFRALYDGRAHLVEQFVITIAPTIADVRGAPPCPPAAGRGSLVLAVPDARAPAVEVEAIAVAGLLPDATILLGDAATCTALREGLPGPGLVHIACHGLFRPGNPLFSSLRLADRWITSAEVLDLDLGGALVTLSACESGRNGPDTAEPVGLAWAFLAAGASGAVVSQWVVHDATAGRLMTAFYRHLVAGRAPADALREAQLVAVAERAHPFYWAAFSFVAVPVRDRTPR